MTIIDFNTPSSLRLADTVTIWTKTIWENNWERDFTLWPDRVTWTCQPDVPSAILHYRYGIYWDGSQYQGRIKRTDLMRRYVKIEFGRTPTSVENFWFGVIENVQDMPWGDHVSHPDVNNGDPVPAGDMLITAYGLEMLLQKSTELTTYEGWQNDARRARPYNEFGQPNRAPDKVGGQPYQFLTDVPKADYWSTRDIVEHVIKRVDSQVPFTIQDNELLKLSDKDAPIVERHGVSAREIINAMAPRQRLYTWYLRPAMNIGFDPAEPETLVNLVIRTFTGTPIDTGTFVIPANQIQYEISAGSSADVQCSTSASSVDRYDQVVAIGARRRTCFTAQLSNIRAVDTPYLAPAWTQAEEDDYNLGGSNEAGYPPAAEREDRREFTRVYRNRPELRNVFSRWQFNEDWTGEIYLDDEAATVYVDPINDATPDDGNYYQQLYPFLEFLNELPLQVGQDYSDDRIATGAAQFVPGAEYLRPEVYLAKWKTKDLVLPDWVEVSNYGNRYEPVTDEDDPGDFSMSRSFGRKSVSVTVQGGKRAQQHRIARGIFTGLSHDKDGDVGGKDKQAGCEDFRFMRATLAFEINRYCQGRFPPVDVIEDHPRVLSLNMGDHYRKDLILKGTIVGVTAENNLVKVSQSAFLRDDEPRLQEIARLAWEWYRTERTAYNMSTLYRTQCDDIGAGDFVINYYQTGQAQPVNSVITLIEAHFPRVIGRGEQRPEPPRWMMQTAFANFDFQRARL